MRPHRMCGIADAHNAHEFVLNTWTADFQQIYGCPGVPHRTEVAPGPCWHNSGTTWPGESWPVRCELLAGHAGAHEADRGAMGGTAVWPNDPGTADTEEAPA